MSALGYLARTFCRKAGVCTLEACGRRELPASFLERLDAIDGFLTEAGARGERNLVCRSLEPIFREPGRKAWTTKPKARSRVSSDRERIWAEMVLGLSTALVDFQVIARAKHSDDA
jgi:hypothetical protein